MTKKPQRYRLIEGKKWIEVRVKSPLQLFDARDPAPFRERDLDDDFVEYIGASIKEASTGAPLRIVIYIEESETKDLHESAVREAILSYYNYQLEILSGELRLYRKKAQLFLAIGLGVLAGCIGIAQNLHVPTPPGWIGILREGIVIFGWVSVWKPIELVLFDWYPMLEKMNFFRAILKTELEIKFNSSQE